jgi:UDP-N-acetylmuramoyl-tripeptide--D-alanyl-D-alanine ligase
MATVIPTNVATFGAAEIAAATTGVLAGADVAIVGVTTDSRRVAAGNVFVALSGERFDGHAHARLAADSGAVAVVVSRDVDVPASCSVIRVADTTLALGAMARAYRRRWSALPGGRPRRVVAITGSAGKTTTRRAIAALLSHVGHSVHAAEGNLNNAIGVPMVLFGLDARHDVAVIEVGTSSPGEIAHGASVCEPDVSVLTLVAAAHTELLGGLDGVATEKGALLAGTDPRGAVVVNGDDARVVAQLGRTSARVLRYGESAGCDVHIAARAADGIAGATITLDGPLLASSLAFHTPLLGVAGAYATAAAVAVARALGDDVPRGDAFSSLASGDARLAPVTLADGTLLIDDSYNANRASVESSLGTAGELAVSRGARLVAVLGEMRELGALSASEHDAVGRRAVAVGAASVIAVSGDAARVAAVAREAGVEAVFAADAAAAVSLVRARVRAGDVVLIKGSRGVGLETVVRALSAPNEASS